MVMRVWYSFGRVRFGIIYFLVSITSLVFSGLTPSPHSDVHPERVDRADYRGFEEIFLAV